MPERRKLAAVVLQKVMSAAPEGSWIAVAVEGGDILAVASTASEALVQARKKRPDAERDQLAMLFKERAERA